jgi:hypothetical protein
MAAPATDAPSSRVIDRLVRTLSGNKIKPVAQAPLTTTGSEKAMSMLKTKQKWPALARLKNLGKLKKSTKAAQHSAVDPHGSLPISPVAGDDSKAVGDSGKQALDPADLAQKVQDLTNTLQTPTPGSTHPAPKPHPPARGRDGRPIPPPGSTPIKDADLIALLQDASYMNGSEEEGRPSIWSILDSIGAPTRTEDGEGDGDGDENPSAGDVSVMVYAPLVPTANSKVELARTLTVDIDPSTSLARKPSLWTTMWPWSGKTAIPSVPPAPQDPKEGDQDDKGKVGQGKGGNAPIQRPVWVPSTTKISLQALWWGYRM